MRLLSAKLTSALPSRPMLTKMMTFGLVGIANTLVDLAVFTVAYQIFNVPLVPANIMAWLVAVSGSYVLNTMITFRKESGRIIRRADYFRFIASGVLGVVATTTTLVILANFISVLLAKLTSILVSFCVNFALSHFVVFRNKPPTEPSEL